MNCLTIKELKSNDEILEAFPVMKQLLNQLSDSTYLQLVKEAQKKDCFHLFALRNGEDIVALIGYKPKINPFIRQICL